MELPLLLICNMKKTKAFWGFHHWKAFLEFTKNMEQSGWENRFRKKRWRTIYTYFKNKKDIYNAVIESESDKVIKKLSEIVSLSITPDQKLMEFIFQRFEAMKDLVYRNGSLRAGFFRDVRKVERARKATSPKEIRILETILQEGVDQGMFRIKHVDKTAMVMLLCLQGLDVPYIRDNFQELGIEKNKLRDYLYDFILYGIKQ